VRVIGIHPDILRTFVYMDIKDAGIMNLEAAANSLHLNPAAGVRVEELREELSQIEGVAMIQLAAEVAEGARGVLEQFINVFRVIQMAVLVMAFLIAFNTTRTNVDERRRELATMFAFGTRIRTVLRMAVVENLIIGVLGTAVGIVLGRAVMRAVLLVRFETMAPELDPVMTVSTNTLGLAVLFGVVVVAVTPVLMLRQLVNMDVPSTLRVVE
jgi:ABC-type antimicrobial peptide transport system permease subunit